MPKGTPHINNLAKRHERLRNGCCPLHNIGLAQIGVSTRNVTVAHNTPSTRVAIVGCPRKDCVIVAYAYSHEGPFRILPHLDHLLRDYSVYRRS